MATPHFHKTELESSRKRVKLETNENQTMRRIELQDYTRFSESILWNLMMEFYSSHSWSNDTVPSFITSNCYIAKSYARLIVGYIQDLVRLQKVNVQHKIYIIELGGGSGRLAFYILKELEKVKHRIPFPFQQVVYVLTDFAEANVQSWEKNEGLRPFVKNGRLDFAQYEAEKGKSLQLRVSGDVLQHKEVSNPVCVVANYLIDTLSHDLFQIKNGVLMEGLVSVGYSTEQDSKYHMMGPNLLPKEIVESESKQTPSCTVSDIIEHLDNLYKYQEIDSNYYGHGNIDSHFEPEVMKHILSWYHQYFQAVDEDTGQRIDASFLIPIGFLRAVRNLCSLTGGQAFVLVGDKGGVNPDGFQGLCDPHIAKHGSFSFMVNFHSIILYSIYQGGCAFMTPEKNATIHVHGYVFPGDNHSVADASTDFEECNCDRQISFTNLADAFQDFVYSFTPNDFYMLQKSLQHESQPSLSSILSLLRLSNHDPLVFSKFRRTMIEEAPHVSSMLKMDVLKVAHLLWENNYPMDNYGTCDLAFELGRLCFGLQIYPKAISYYCLSIQLFEVHHVTYYNIGLCYFETKQYALALKHFQKSLEMNSEYIKAQEWIDIATKKMRQIQM